MAFTDKVKNLIRSFLGNQADTKYITTEAGLKLQISDKSWTDKTRTS